MPPLVSVLPRNTQGRDFVVGDLHGCASAFQAARQAVEFRPAVDRIIAVGDLIDRGPESLDILDTLHRSPWFFSVRGNHEQMLLDHIAAPSRTSPLDDIWIQKVARSFTDRQRLFGRIRPILDRLPTVIQVGEVAPEYFVVHAELLDEQSSVTPSTVTDWSFANPAKAQRRALWGRALMEAYRHGAPVRRAHAPDLPLIACGHSIVRNRPIMLARQVFLDGGAYIPHDPVQRLKWDARGDVPQLRLWQPGSSWCWTVDTRTNNVSQTSIKIPAQL
jgi:serine/threonine protein phosphatase 1